MKNSIKKLLVMSAIGMSFIAVQNVSATTYQVDGEIIAVNEAENSVDIGTITINGMKLDYLCQKYEICLAGGETVSITYYDYFCEEYETDNYKATSITSDGLTVPLR